MKTYNTVVTSKEVEVLNDVAKRCPYECIELGEGRLGFMDNENGDIRNYFCDTLGYECSNYEAFDFEYFDNPQNISVKKQETKDIEISYSLNGSSEIAGSISYQPGNNKYLAVGLSRSKWFKTLKGAKSWMEKNGYVECLETVPVVDLTPSSEKSEIKNSPVKNRKVYTREAYGMKVEAYEIFRPDFIKKGIYKETDLDRHKKEVDFLIIAIDDKYTVSFNHPINLKENRSVKKANNNGFVYYVTDNALNKLKEKYTWLCDF